MNPGLDPEHTDKKKLRKIIIDNIYGTYSRERKLFIIMSVFLSAKLLYYKVYMEEGVFLTSIREASKKSFF